MFGSCEESKGIEGNEWDDFVFHCLFGSVLEEDIIPSDLKYNFA